MCCHHVLHLLDIIYANCFQVGKFLYDIILSEVKVNAPSGKKIPKKMASTGGQQ
jgi:hypothetical protein